MLGGESAPEVKAQRNDEFRCKAIRWRLVPGALFFCVDTLCPVTPEGPIVPCNRVRHLMIGLLAGLCVTAAPLTVVHGQEPPPDDPSSPGNQGTSTTSRPGVINRRNPPAQPTEPAAEQQEPSDEQPAEPTDGEPSEPVPVPTPADNEPAAPAPEPAEPEAGGVGSGPRVITPEELELELQQPNFEEAFDPFNPPANTRVQIDFNQAELADVVMWISALTGENFIIADTISASKKITIISPEPVSIAEAERAFYAALNMNGLTVVPFGRFLKIVESTTASRQALDPTDSVGEIPNDDRMVTHIHQLRHVAIDVVQPVLEALKSDAAQIVTYSPTNTLIITESGLNLRRLLDVLTRLDVPSGQEQINMYQVRYADAEELSSVLLEIFPAEEEGAPVQQEAAPRRRRNTDESAEQAADALPVAESVGPGSVQISQIISDTRTNQLIIIANERSFSQIVTIIEQLDVPIPGEGQVHVMHLENADATELASTLQSLTQSVEQMREEANGGQQVADGATEAPVGPVSATFSGSISITADESTNSLVVVASLRDFLALQNVVRQLDRRRQQVYVEAVIMEVNINRTNQFGIAFNGGALPEIQGEQSPLFGATRLGSLSSLTLDPTSLMGMAIGLRGPTIDGSENALGIGIPSFGAILQAMQTDNDVNVLSTPHILTMDNEEAEIIVGENIPFISGIQQGLGNLGGIANQLGGQNANNPLSNLGNLGGLAGLGGLGGFGGVQVQRQDVALTLRITPQINESNFVRLEIEEEVEDVQSIDPVLGPRTTTRQARTTVVVQDQQTVVIGGLMRDTQSVDVTKVPVLGDIPLIGNLFRNRTTRNVKTNLLLLLTPYIIRDPQDFQEIYRIKMEEREEFMRYFGRVGADYVRSVDYNRKDGPLQHMFETIQEAVEEEEARLRAFSEPVEERPIAQPSSEPLRMDLGTTPAPSVPSEAAPAPAAPTTP
jgi:general secretion pathway protein D